MILKQKQFVVGVDIGGTWVRAALFNSEKKTLEKMRESINLDNDKALSLQIIRMICNLIQKLNVPITDVEGVGIASTGPLDTKKGILVKPTNLPFERISLVDPIKRKLRVPVILVNDCTAAVLGERMFGRGKGIDNLFYVAIGTGIGGGAIVDGNLIMGKDGNAAEIGHFVIDYEGKLACGCGKRGHWEAYCSGRNIPNFVQLKLKKMNLGDFKNSPILVKTFTNGQGLTSKALFNAAKRGDQLSMYIVKEIGLLNAIGFANIINAYDPSMILVGGTIALNNEELFFPSIIENVGDYAINKIPEIGLTSLGEDTGLFGGIATILSQKGK